MQESPSRCGVWIQAARPRTLWAAFAPVLLGTALAHANDGAHAPAALACLLFAFLLQIGANFCNDYADFRKGADTPERVGPLRVTAAGLISPRDMVLATAAVFAAAFFCGIYLVSRAGEPFIIVVALAVLSGLAYTAGPFPLGYLGLGEIFVLFFFGPVAVGGTYFVQTLRWEDLPAAAGLGPGLLAVAILVVNNLRDMETDAKAGKRTLAVRFGATFARFEYVSCLAGAAVLALAMMRWFPASWIGALFLIPAVPALRSASRDSGGALNPLLGQTARLLLIYSVLLSAAVVWP